MGARVSSTSGNWPYSCFCGAAQKPSPSSNGIALSYRSPKWCNVPTHTRTHTHTHKQVLPFFSLVMGLSVVWYILDCGLTLRLAHLIDRVSRPITSKLMRHPEASPLMQQSVGGPKWDKGLRWAPRVGWICAMGHSFRWYLVTSVFCV